MWDAVSNVTTLLTAIAFLAALALSAYLAKLKADIKILNSSDEVNKIQVSEILNKFHYVDTSALTKEQKKTIILEQIENKYSTLKICFYFASFLLVATATYLLVDKFLSQSHSPGSVDISGLDAGCVLISCATAQTAVETRSFPAGIVGYRKFEQSNIIYIVSDNPYFDAVINNKYLPYLDSFAEIVYYPRISFADLNVSVAAGSRYLTISTIRIKINSYTANKRPYLTLYYGYTERNDIVAKVSNIGDVAAGSVYVTAKIIDKASCDNFNTSEKMSTQDHANLKDDDSEGHKRVSTINALKYISADLNDRLNARIPSTSYDEARFKLDTIKPLEDASKDSSSPYVRSNFREGNTLCVYSEVSYTGNNSTKYIQKHVGTIYNVGAIGGSTRYMGRVDARVSPADLSKTLVVPFHRTLQPNESELHGLRIDFEASGRYDLEVSVIGTNGAVIRSRRVVVDAAIPRVYNGEDDFGLTEFGCNAINCR